MTAKILVVDDDPAISEMLTIVLQTEGFDTVVVGDGNDAVTAAQEHDPDLILLDVMLPGMSGIDVCRTVREFSTMPIVMLTARTDTVDVVLGLESGADDYITKPFKPKELIARVRARLRRSPEESAESTTIRVGEVEIDTAGHEVTRGGEVINLTPIEFDLLTTLASRPGQVFSREELLEKVWGYRKSGDTRLVNVHVQRLRSKVERDPDDPQVVLTVRGIGYKSGE
ncbi:MAG TPA: response regulator transcription factor [Corynebacterium urealyticum]|nr:response regulator transcription factor [Corynebacterium urealyticum]